MIAGSVVNRRHSRLVGVELKDKNKNIEAKTSIFFKFKIKILKCRKKFVILNISISGHIIWGDKK